MPSIMLTARPCSLFIFLLVIVAVSICFMKVSPPSFIAHGLSQDPLVKYKVHNAPSIPLELRDPLENALGIINLYPPHSRLFTMYVPMNENRLKEVASFIESWRYVFEIPDLDYEPPDLILQYIDKLNTSNIHGNEYIAVNDVLIVASPDIKPELLPNICQELKSPYTHHDLKFGERLERRTSKCFYIFVSLDLTEASMLWSSHLAMHSMSFMTEPVVNNIMMRYDLVLRTDSDCFLLPGIRSEIETPWVNEDNKFDFHVGNSGYKREGAATVLQLYRDHLHLNGNIPSGIGSTLYGRPADLINVATLTMKVGRYLLQHDAVFARGQGLWPTWYKGVGSLYSGDFAVNHIIESERVEVKSDTLDSESISGESIYSGPLHVHCWHTENFFSKHKMAHGEYTTKTLQLYRGGADDIRFAAAAFALVGAWRYSQERHTNKLTYDGRLVKERLLFKANETSVCPPEYPYPVHAREGNFAFCCRYKPIVYKESSEDFLFRICKQRYVYNEAVLNAFVKSPYYREREAPDEYDTQQNYLECGNKNCVSPLQPLQEILNFLLAD